MSYTDPYVTLQKNTSTVQAEIMVGKSSDDLPASLVDRQEYGVPGAMRKEFTIQSWKDIDQDGQIHIRQAKNTSILPYGNVFQPTSTVATGGSALVPAQTISWAVDSFESVIEHVYVELNLQYNAAIGTDITLAPFISWFTEGGNGIRLYFNDNEGQVINMNGDVEYRAYGMERQDEERVILANVANINATTFDGNTIAGAGVGTPVLRTYRFRLPGFWEVVPWPMRTVQRFNLKLNLPTLATYQTAGAAPGANLQVLSWNLIFDPRVVSPTIYKALSAAWFQGISIKYMEYLLETAQQTVTGTPTVIANTINLNNIQGLTPQINVVIRNTTPTGANKVVTYDEIATILLQDSSGTALLGQQQIRTDFLNTHAIIENQLFSLMPSTSTKVYYPIMFGEGGWVAWKRNFMRIQGYQSLLRNRFILTPNTSAAGASRLITFECYRMIFLEFKAAGTSGMMNMTVVRF